MHRILTTLTVHLLALAFSGTMASGQAPTLIVQTGHQRPVMMVAISADGRVLVSQSHDGTAIVWDTATGHQARTIKIGTLPVPISLTQDGKTLATNGNGIGEIKLWDLETGEELLTLKIQSTNANSLAFSPDGKLLAAGEGASVRIWEVPSGRALGTFAGSAADINSLAFSGDGRTLCGGSDDKSVAVWEVATRKLLRRLKGHTARVSSVAISPDGKVIASGSWDRTVRLWNAETGQAIKTLSAHMGYVTSVAIDGDGKTLVSAGGDAIRLWDLASGQERQQLVGVDAVVSIALNAAGTIVAGGGLNNSIRIWDLSTGKPVRDLRGYSYQINALGISSNGKTLALGRFGGGVKLWNLTAGTTRPPLVKDSLGSDALAFSEDGTLLASVGESSVEVWDLSGTEPRISFNQPADNATTVSLSADGRILAWGADDQKVHLWDLSTKREMKTIPAQPKAVSCIMLSSDAKMLGTLAFLTNETRIWDVATGRLRQTLVGESSIYSFTFSHNNAQLATVRFHAVDLWDLATGHKLRSMPLDSASPSAVAFSPDDQLLASGNDDGTITLWDPATGQKRQTLAGHTDQVTAVAFNAAGDMLVSGSLDYTARLWDVGAGRELASLIAIDEQDWLVIAPDGSFDGTNAAWNRILWRFSPKLTDVLPAEAFFAEYYYPGLLNDVLSGRRPRAPTAISQKDRRQPELTLTQPAGATVAGLSARPAKIQINITRAPAGAQDVRLFRDGTLVKVWPGDVLQGKDQVTLSITVPVVAGENRFTAYAFNRDNVKSIDAHLTVKGASFLVRQPVLTILAFGVNEYANPEYNLKYAVADARDLATELQRQQRSIGHFARIEVVTLLDRDATKANIMNALAQQVAHSQPEDTLVIFFAGHGIAFGNRFYLVPHDLGYTGSKNSLDQSGLQTLLAHGISDEELESAMEGIDAAQMLLVIDACNSGQALEAEEKRRGPMNSKGLAQLAYEKGMYILTAAQSYQAALEASKLGHGYLTYALVEEGLKTGQADREPKDGRVYLREWLDFATARVPVMQQEKLDEGKPSPLPLTPQANRLLLQQVVSFTNGEETIAPAQRTVQRPRVFYRRESEQQPMVIARP